MASTPLRAKKLAGNGRRSLQQALRLSIEQIARPYLQTPTIYTDRFMTSKSGGTIFEAFAWRLSNYEFIDQLGSS
ncbi:hypothetical protein GNZ12_28070 [Paraburkholderia sp. 1N]|uniref:Uncharacterized protein n=1 Tax=Paraburkholderia solitsugae TaxID=2675748 RepID=A0ABX2BWH9_9BURK|nr:hypothetical protein [Paraburkholderia solitsugae]NPT45109.1 hypothetical protein [Paraburkholderia solitsugae]